METEILLLLKDRLAKKDAYMEGKIKPFAGQIYSYVDALDKDIEQLCKVLAGQKAVETIQSVREQTKSTSKQTPIPVSKVVEKTILEEMMSRQVNANQETEREKFHHLPDEHELSYGIVKPFIEQLTKQAVSVRCLQQGKIFDVAGNFTVYFGDKIYISDVFGPKNTIHYTKDSKRCLTHLFNVLGIGEY